MLLEHVLRVVEALPRLVEHEPYLHAREVAVSWGRCMVMGRRCGPKRTSESCRSPSPAWGSKLMPANLASRSARLSRTACGAAGRGTLIPCRSLRSRSLPSALWPARTNALKAAVCSLEAGSSASAEDTRCRYLACSGLPALRWRFLGAAGSVLGEAGSVLGLFLRFMIKMLAREERYA